MLLSAVSVLVVAQSSLEIPEGLMYNPVYDMRIIYSTELWYRGFWALLTVPRDLFVVKIFIKIWND